MITIFRAHLHISHSPTSKAALTLHSCCRLPSPNVSLINNLTIRYYSCCIKSSYAILANPMWIAWTTWLNSNRICVLRKSGFCTGNSLRWRAIDSSIISVSRIESRDEDDDSKNSNEGSESYSHSELISPFSAEHLMDGKVSTILHKDSTKQLHHIPETSFLLIFGQYCEM